jgi:FeoB-associated Cys-rich membrane protein
MEIADWLWMALFLGGAGYLLYRSFWKKKGGCHDCSGCSCGTKK